MIEPKKITLKSDVWNEEKTFRLGKYPALDGIELLGLFAEVIDVAARKKTKTANGLFGGNLRVLAERICQHVEVELSSGNWQALDSETLINAHVPDYEMLLKLVREAHDFNSNFFNTGRLLKTSLSFMDKVKAQASKMFTQLSDSYLAKEKPRSKSSKKTTA